MLELSFVKLNFRDAIPTHYVDDTVQCVLLGLKMLLGLKKHVSLKIGSGSNSEPFHSQYCITTAQ